jgi:hypothetical protein
MGKFEIHLVLLLVNYINHGYLPGTTGDGKVASLTVLFVRPPPCLKNRVPFLSCPILSNPGRMGRLRTLVARESVLVSHPHQHRGAASGSFTP